MDTLMNKNMITPNPTPNFDYEGFIKFLCGLLALFSGYAMYLNKYFKDKESRTKAFISAIAKKEVSGELITLEERFEKRMDEFERKLSHFNDSILAVLSKK